MGFLSAIILGILSSVSQPQNPRQHHRHNPAPNRYRSPQRKPGSYSPVYMHEIPRVSAGTVSFGPYYYMDDNEKTDEIFRMQIRGNMQGMANMMSMANSIRY